MARLGDFCDINMGQSPDSSSYNDAGQGLPFYQGNADFGVRYPMPRVYCSQPCKIAHKGDVLISVRAPIGALNIANETCCIGRGLAAIAIDENKCSKEYFWYAIAAKVDELNAKGTGSTFKAISKSVLFDTNIVLPALNEQKKAYGCLSLVDELISLRKKQLQKLDDLVKSRFVEMFGDPIRNPMAWDIYQLDECLERIDNGKSFVCSDKPRQGDFPAVLKLSAATYGDYRPNENKALLDESQFVTGAEIHSGDLLFTRKNTPELVGMATYVQETPKKLMMPDLIFRLVTNERMSPIFLWQLINCKEFRPVIQGISGGSAKSMSNISKERLGKIRVICPPRKVQEQLDPFISHVDKSKLTVQQGLDKLELLKQSLMQKYFG